MANTHSSAVRAFLLVIVYNLCASLSVMAIPTELRAWTSSSGTRIDARAISVENGVVHLQSPDNRVLRVPLAKFSGEDQAFLRKHFAIVQVDEIPPAPALVEDDSITQPKGQALGPISAGEGSTYHLYIPKSLPRGRKHPLMMILNPHHGNNGTLTRYQAGAERNGWILITSVESANEVNSTEAMSSILKAIDHAKSTLPVDPERIFTGGFSGGSARSFQVAAEIKSAGILACGMGGEYTNTPVTRDLPIYILAGSNCYHRTAGASTLAKFGPKSKDSLARYFPGNHDRASAELMEDGMTHLHAVALSKRRDRLAEEANANEAAILRFAAELKESNPSRALMWTTFLIERPANMKLLPAVRKLHSELAKDPKAVRWVEGLKAIHRFTADEAGKEELFSLQGSWGKSVKKLEKLDAEFADTAWKETLDRMLQPEVAP